MAFSEEDLIKISDWAVYQTRQVIIKSANIPYGVPPKTHRGLGIALMRRWGQTSKQKEVMREISSFNIDMLPDRDRYHLNRYAFHLASLNAKLTCSEMVDLISTYPRKGEKGRTPLRHMESAAVNALMYGIGNCGETSCYAFLLLTEYPQQGIPGLPKVNEKINVEHVGFNKPYAL